MYNSILKDSDANKILLFFRFPSRVFVQPPQVSSANAHTCLVTMQDPANDALLEVALTNAEVREQERHLSVQKSRHHFPLRLLAPSRVIIGRKCYYCEQFGPDHPFRAKRRRCDAHFTRKDAGVGWASALPCVSVCVHSKKKAPPHLCSYTNASWPAISALAFHFSCAMTLACNL